MPGYFVANFQITNQERYAEYQQKVLPTLMKHGARVVVADYESQRAEGEPGSAMVVLEFDSVEAARDWYYSSEYQDVIGLRTSSSEGALAVFADGFVMPEGLAVPE